MNMRNVACALAASIVAFPATGQTINTFAGGWPAVGVAVPATSGAVAPYGSVAVDTAGNRYVASFSTVVKVDPSGLLTVVAGNGTYGFSGDGGPATSATLSTPVGVAVDLTGNLYIADQLNQRIRKVDTSGTITTVAGNGAGGFSGDGGQAASSSLCYPASLVTDAAGDLYISDSCNQRIRKVDTSGTITTVAGNGGNGFSGDGGPATSASMSGPYGITFDSTGNLYFVDQGNNRIRKIDTSGIITTVAGNGTLGYSGDGGPATSASLGYPTGVVFDASGNFYISDLQNSRIRKVDTTGTISTFAGNGLYGYSGDGGPATSASLSKPQGVGIDSAGTLYISDQGNYRLREVNTSGTITTLAGNGTPVYLGDGGPATAAGLAGPAGLAFDAAGDLYIADQGNQRIRKVDTSRTITTVAGNGTYGLSGDGGSATGANLANPAAVAFDAAGNLYIADQANNRIRKVNASGTIATVVGGGPAPGFSEMATSAAVSPDGSIASDGKGNRYIGSAGRVLKVDTGGMLIVVAGDGTSAYSGDGGPATSAGFSVTGVAVDTAGNLYIADTYNYRVRKVDTSGTITTVAGNGTSGYSGDGGPATSASLSYCGYSVAVDTAGNLYIADPCNYRVRKVDASGTITTVAGTGVDAYYGDGGAATSAFLTYPSGVAVDVAGNLYIADLYSERIRKVDASGIITTVAGNGTPGYSGDGGPATSASLSYPAGVAVDTGGNLYIVDPGNIRIRKVDTSGTISTVAGNGTSGYSGDGGPATSASLTYPTGVGVDTGGNVYIADNYRVREVDANGVITTFAGNGTYTFGGDGGAAVNADLYRPTGVAFDVAGDMYIADAGNQRIRKVDTSSTITTVAGNGTPGYSGDGGPATSASFSYPSGVAVDVAGNLYIADQATNRIRIVSGIAVAPGAPTAVSATASNTQATVSFTAPASNGGAVITSYTVTSSGGQTASGAVSPITVAGLTNGTAYTFTVTATNAAGTGPASAASNSVTPFTVPGAPTSVAASAGNAQATVSFTAPASNGGAVITSYAVTSSGGQTARGAVSPITVAGLTNGTAYTFTVTATNAAGTGPASAPSSSVTPSTTSLSPSSLSFASEQVGTTSTTRLVTVSNSGTTSLTIGTISTTANFTHPSKTCGSSLAANSTCTISVAFAPTTAGSLTGTLTVGTIGTVALNGTGVAPVATLSPTSFIFGNEYLGTTSAGAVFTFTNAGIASIKVSRVSLGGTNSNQFTIPAASNLCAGQTLTTTSPGNSCTFTVSFNPTSVGSKSATVTVNSTSGTTSFSVNSTANGLTGMGVVPATLKPTSWTFGNQQVGTTSAGETFTYSNTGSGSVIVTGVSLGSSAQFAIGNNACGVNLVLGPNGSCQVTVTFNPTSTGSKSASLAVSGKSGAASFSVGSSLSGTGVAPRLSFGASSYNYGTVTAAKAHTFTLSNTGTAPYQIAGIALTTGTQFAVTGGTCSTTGAGATVNNGSSCTVIVTFTPGGTSTFTDTLTVTGSGAGAGAPTYTATVGLSGS
jgi:hypothetical protein